MSESQRPVPSRLYRLLEELKRRRVYRVAVLYLVIGYGAVEVANNFFPPLHLPDWSITLVAAAVLIGFPIAVLLAWAFDITPEGVKLTDSEGGAHTMFARVRHARGPALVAIGMVIALVTVGAYATFGDESTRGDGDSVSLAVLPFANLSTDPSNEFFSDGVTEDLVAQIATIRNLRVVSRTSVMQYKGTQKTVPQVAGELGVGYVLEGSVRRAGNVVRVTVKLIDARDDRPVWTETYDRDMTALLSLQTEIARSIAEQLRTRLSDDEERRLAVSEERQLVPAAYDDYLRGVAHAAAGRQREAIQWFENAVAKDPELAPAHVGLARAWFFLGFHGFESPRVAFERMGSAAALAAAADPSLADAHAVVALHQAHYELDFVDAEQHFRRALELAPNNAQVHHDYAHFLLALGRIPESAAESDRAAALDPANSMLTACAGWHGFTNGDYAEAVESAQRALMMMPGMFWPEMIQGWAYQQTGQTDDAVNALRRAVELSDRSVLALASLGHALAQAGRTAEARDVLAELRYRSAREYVAAYDLAVLHAALGETDASLDALENARTQRDGFLVHAGWDPRLAGLHGDPRFDGFLRGVGLPRQAIAPARGMPAPSGGAMMAPMAS